MTTFHGLSMAFFITVILSIGTFKNFLSPDPKIFDLCGDIKTHPFLCDQKIALQEAKVSDFALIDGISLKRARLMVKFIAHKKTYLRDLKDIKGIGDKTIEKLTRYFY
jgi:hypothetical protein